MAAQTDTTFMQMALALAQRGLGDTWPNPAVGCVIVRHGIVVGRGWTQSGGRPHAETEALRRAGQLAKGATAYVTLEPCSHHGKTPPCAEALIAAGVERVVSATTDPDPRVSGQGHAKLRAAGIEVVEGVGKAEADDINAGFFSRVTKKRPLFALKLATSLDGRIALAKGQSQWITGEHARATVQSIRAKFDAILVGSETVLQDNPSLTCRLPGYAGRPKVRVVLDRRLRVGVEHKVMQTARETPTWVYTHQKSSEALASSGGNVITINDDPSPRPSPLQIGEGAGFIGAVIADLAAKGLTRVLIEGGGQVAASFLQAGLIDQVFWFRAGQVLGGDARPSVGELALDQLAVAPHFKRRDTLRLGQDVLDILDRSPT
jgi:diaminohydroxyphosphoribosylaminopyrimidine deaminase / 5-amino-6-(5-phosphoribosylamino)uracil reductase